MISTFALSSTRLLLCQTDNNLTLHRNLCAQQLERPCWLGNAWECCMVESEIRSCCMQAMTLEDLAIELHTNIQAAFQRTIRPQYVLLRNEGGLQPYILPDR